MTMLEWFSFILECSALRFLAALLKSVGPVIINYTITWFLMFWITSETLFRRKTKAAKTCTQPISTIPRTLSVSWPIWNWRKWAPTATFCLYWNDSALRISYAAPSRLKRKASAWTNWKSPKNTPMASTCLSFTTNLNWCSSSPNSAVAARNPAELTPMPRILTNPLMVTFLSRIGLHVSVCLFRGSSYFSGTSEWNHQKIS